MGYQTYMSRRGVQPDYVKRLGLRNVPGGFRMPYFDADGNVMFEQKRHIPPIIINGEEAKCTFAKGAKVDFDHLPLTDGRSWREDVYPNPAVDIIITESVSKAAVLAQLGYAVLTTGSTWTHRTRRNTKSEPVPGFDLIPWAGRRVGVLWDNDVYENPNVQDALFDIGHELTTRGALVEAWLLPRPKWSDVKDEFIKFGVDDYVARKGDRAARAIAKLPRLPLDDPMFATWGKHRSPPKPNVVDSLTFPPIPLSVFTQPPKPRQYVCDPIIGKRQIMLFVAAGGMGKGFAMLELAICVATGHKWFGFPVTQGRVVLLSFEDDPEEVYRRLHDIVEVHARRLKIIGKKLEALHAQISDNVRCESLEGKELKVITMRDQNIRQTPELAVLAQKLKALNPILIIPDPMSQLHTLPETSEVGAALIGAMNYLKMETGAAIAIPSHVSKAANAKAKDDDIYALRGTTGVVNGARSVVNARVLTAQEVKDIFDVDPNTVEIARVTHAKNNYGPKGPTFYLVRGNDGVWEPHDVTKIPFRDKDTDAAQWLSKLEDWLSKQKHPYFSQRDVTQNKERVTAIFGSGYSRATLQRCFDEALIAGTIRKVKQSELPQGASAGGGERYTVADKVSR